jgi:hypothetical protein
MIYVAMTFWLLFVVLTAWGVHQLWSGMVRPKVFNIVLLPGTLVAQLGHVLGLLVTGATVSNTSLVGDDESAAPRTTRDPKPRIPLVGPIVIGMLPLIACGVAIFVVARFLGGALLGQMSAAVAGPTLPGSLAGTWQLARDLVTLTESFTVALRAADYGSWRTWVFLYLLVCLSVRMAPFPGYLRGSLIAILLLGIVLALIASLFGVGDPRMVSGWAILNLTVAVLLLLLLVSLLVRGGIGLYHLLRSGTE